MTSFRVWKRKARRSLCGRRYTWLETVFSYSDQTLKSNSHSKELILCEFAVVCSAAIYDAT